MIAAAESVVRESGADALDMGEVAKRAGVSRASLYRAVGGRGAVLEALAARGLTARPKDARAKVLLGAKTVFVKRGFEAATIEQIANCAGVSEATVYRLFGDKEGVVSAFFEEFSPRRAARAIRDRSTGDLRDDLRRFAEHSLELAAESPEFIRVMLIEGLKQGSLVARVRAHSPARTLDGLVSIFAAHAEQLRGVTPLDAAQAFAGTMMGFGVFGPALHGFAAPDPKETAAKIVALFCEGALDVRRTARDKSTASRKKHR